MAIQKIKDLNSINREIGKEFLSSRFEKKTTVKNILCDSPITSKIREVGGANQNKTNSELSWCFTSISYDIEINPILGGNLSKNNELIGVNMIKPKTSKYCLEVQKKDILDNYKLDLQVKHRKRRTVARYFDSAKKFLDHTTEINNTEVKRYIVYLNETYRANTVTSNIQGMNVFLDYLGHHDLRKPIPKWTQIRRDTITLDEIIKIRQLAKKDYDLIEYLFILLFTEFDCRPSEIAKAKWSWIKGNKVYFEDCKTPDAPEFISSELQLALQEWREYSRHFKRKDKDYIFFNTQGRYKGEPLSEQTWKVRYFVKEISLKAIGRELTPTDLKASVITEEFNHRINPKTIQRKARHQSWKTTARYNHSDEKDLEEYVSEGMIFSENIEPISKKGNDKRGYINPFCTQEILLNECEGGETNSSFSFSFSFFFFYNYSSLPARISNKARNRRRILQDAAKYAYFAPFLAHEILGGHGKTQGPAVFVTSSRVSPQRHLFTFAGGEL